MTEPRPCPGCGASAARDAGAKDGHALVRCRGCGTLFTALLPTSESLHEYYGQYYGDSNLSVPEFVTRRLDDIVAGFAAHRQTNRLLDVGCGAATLLEAARRAGWETEGTEVSEAAVMNARGRGFTVFFGGLAEAQLPPARFDVVTVVEVLEHLLDPLSLLHEVRRILRPGGLVWATTPHGRGISARLLRSAWSVVSPPEHIQLFSARGVRALFHRAGFSEVRIAAHGVNPVEIVRHFRGDEVMPSQRVESAYALNERLSASRSRRAVKAAANSLLSMLRLGDSLKVSARSAAEAVER